MCGSRGDLFVDTSSRVGKLSGVVLQLAAPSCRTFSACVGTGSTQGLGVAGELKPGRVCPV